MVGYLEESELSDISANVDVVAPSGDKVGALVGDVYSSTVTNSSASGSATGADIVGGLIGLASGSASVIANSFAAGNVTANAQAGGLIGMATTAPAAVTESFWNSTANPSLSGGTGVAKTQTQLSDIATFTAANWAIQQGAPATGGTVWGTCVPTAPSVNSGYPFLQWNRTSNPCPTVPPPPVPPKPSQQLRNDRADEECHSEDWIHTLDEARLRDERWPTHRCAGKCHVAR